MQIWQKNEKEFITIIWRLRKNIFIVGNLVLSGKLSNFGEDNEKMKVSII